LASSRLTAVTRSASRPVGSRPGRGFPLRYADRVAVTAWISDYVRRLVIRYDVRNLTQGRRAAHGHTAIATLDREGRLRLETPPEIVARIRG
jgi:acyl-CoA thioesterase FadM